MLAKSNAVVADRYKGDSEVHAEALEVTKRSQSVGVTSNKRKCSARGVKQKEEEKEGNRLIENVASISRAIGKLVEDGLSVNSIPAIMKIIEQTVNADLKAEIREEHSSIDELKELAKVALQGGYQG